MTGNAWGVPGAREVQFSARLCELFAQFQNPLLCDAGPWEDPTASHGFRAGPGSRSLVDNWGPRCETLDTRDSRSWNTASATAAAGCTRVKQSLRQSGLRAGVAVWIVALVQSAWVAVAEQSSAPYHSTSEGVLQLSVHDEMLTVNLRDAPLAAVLEDIARQGEVVLSLPDDRSALEKRVTMQFTDLPLERGLKKLLRGQSVVFIYESRGLTNSKGSRTEHSPDGYRLKEIRLLGPSSEKEAGRAPPSSSPVPVHAREPVQPAPPAARPGPSPTQEPRTGAPSPESIRTREQAEKALAGLLQGNMDALQEMVQALKRDNPELRDQIDQFMESLEEARRRAEQEGTPFPPLDPKGVMAPFMDQMIRSRTLGPSPELQKR